MFIVVIGAMYSGKSTLEDYLVSHHGFTSVHLESANHYIRPRDDHEPESGSQQTRYVDFTHTTTHPQFFPVPPLHIPHGRKEVAEQKGVVFPCITLQNKTRREGDIDSFLTLNSPNPADPSDRVGGETSVASQSGGVLTRAVWSENPQEMLNHVTRDWRNHYVTTDDLSYDELHRFTIRPFVLVVKLDAPILDRFRRMTRLAKHHVSLEKFIIDHDAEVYGRHLLKVQADGRSPIQELDKLVHLRIDNSFQSIPEFHAHLDSLDLLNVDRLRPHWDTYFMHLASLASRRSNCMKRRVGAILVRNNRVVATGYNGTARGLRNCNEGGCPRCNSGGSSGHALDQCVCLHAEENALLEAGRERLGENAVLYCNTCPCLGCSVKIIQSGVKEVVYHLGYKVDEASAALFREAGVIIRRHATPGPL